MKEKKEKKVKNKKAKAAPETESENKKKGKLNLKSPKILIPALVVVMLAAGVCVYLFLTRDTPEGNGEETEIVEEEPVPTVPTDAYTVGTETIPVLSIPEVERVVAEPEEDSAAVSYVFASFPTPAMAAEQYMHELMGEPGYIVVDKYFCQDLLPDFTMAQGTVRMAKEAGDSMINSVIIRWTETECTVSLECVAGVIGVVPEGMTLNEAFEFVKGLNPAVLGLEGESMDEYHVYTESGTVLVGERACMQISVHSRNNPENTNDVSSYFLLSSDGRHIYRLDKAAGTVEELDF